jgi:hypothetical protein
MIAVAQARFSGVWFRVELAQLNTIALDEKQPQMYRNAAVYRAALLSVDTETMKPTQATACGTAI